ncbi:hypothetical protein K438DRAFT_1976714 [Mycena galopus ATCC 62051]|nr:hypothetical protein K438DRAFT_1976714 [Mycena galopus ATCC 62051]
MHRATLSTGPILAGTQFNWALLGLLTLQVYNFHVKFPNERLWLSLVLVSSFLYVSNQLSGRSFSVGETLECFRNSHGLNALSPFSQGWIFFAWRIYVLGGQTSRFVLGICGLIIVINLLQSSLSMITGVIHANTSSQLAEIPGLILAAKICLLGSAICDVVITATMVVLLNHYRKLAPWTKTDSLLTKLIYHTVQTGAITSIVAIAEIVLFLTYPEYLYHEVSGFILGKMYSDIVLTSLNARSTTLFDDRFITANERRIDVGADASAAIPAGIPLGADARASRLLLVALGAASAAPASAGDPAPPSPLAAVPAHAVVAPSSPTDHAPGIPILVECGKTRAFARAPSLSGVAPVPPPDPRPPWSQQKLKFPPGLLQHSANFFVNPQQRRPSACARRCEAEMCDARGFNHMACS